MFHVNQLHAFNARPIYPVGVLAAIQALHLTSGLVLCLDIGDSSCSDLSAQQLTDLSGAGNHFNRGTTSGAEATDPSLNGTANAKSRNEYLGFDGGDICTPTGAVTFDDGFHKDGATFTIACAYYWVSNAALQYIFSNSTSGTVQGISFRVGTTGLPTIAIKNGSASTNQGFAAFLRTAAWNLMLSAHSENAGAGGSYNITNGKWLDNDGTIPTPSATDPAVAPAIGFGGTSTTTPPGNGSRLGFLAIWNRTFSKGELGAFYEAMARRYMP